LLILLVATQGCGHVSQPRVIYIARHGQTEWNRKVRVQGDPDLDPVGYINRVGLWHLLKDRPISAVYTSERLRTRRTAELVARQHKLSVQPRAALNEIDVGIFVGICASRLVDRDNPIYPTEPSCEVRVRGSRPEEVLKRMRPAFRAAMKDRIDGKPPLGQSFRELVAQTVPFVKELRGELWQREVLIVGHGVINRALLHHLMGWPLENVAHLKQANDQVYRLEMLGDLVQLSLYTPGQGWRPCKIRPRPGQRFLDCNPDGQQRASVTKRIKPAPRAAPVMPHEEILQRSKPHQSGQGQSPRQVTPGEQERGSPTQQP
jgi:broad specificity phosphatase PhoE